MTVAHSAGIVISRQLFGAGTAENVSALGSYRFQQSLETDGALQHPLIQQLQQPLPLCLLSRRPRSLTPQSRLNQPP